MTNEQKALQIAIAKLTRIKMGCDDPKFQAEVALKAIEEELEKSDE